MPKKNVLISICAVVFAAVFAVTTIGYSTYLDYKMKPKGIPNEKAVKSINNKSVNMFAKAYDYGEVINDCKIVYKDGKKITQDIIILKPLKGDPAKYSYYVSGNKSNGYGTIYKVINTASGNATKKGEK